MPEVNSNPNESSENGFFGKLANGDFGLAKTYWLYGVLLSVVVNILSSAISSTETLVIIVLALAAYSVPLYMGIWKAANKYKGQKIWSILAKIATVLGVIMVVSSLMTLASIL